MQSLDMIEKSRTMRDIFAKIRDARPGYVPGTWPHSCNVLITPPIDRSYLSGVTATGFKNRESEELFVAWMKGDKARTGGLKLKMSAKCQAEPVSKADSGYDISGRNKGKGSVA